jgi:hypothetical protein
VLPSRCATAGSAWGRSASFQQLVDVQNRRVNCFSSKGCVIPLKRCLWASITSSYSHLSRIMHYAGLLCESPLS